MGEAADEVRAVNDIDDRATGTRVGHARVRV